MIALRRLGFVAAALGWVILIGVGPVLAQQQEITSAGPLTRIITGTDLTCQVAHRDDELFEFFPSSSDRGSCGTFVAIGGTVYGPAGVSPTLTPWTPVSQSPITGSGSAGDPFRLVTVVDAPLAGLRLIQTDTYVVGSQSYRTDLQLTNATAEQRDGILYRAGDCFLQGEDSGFVRVDSGAPACIVDPAEGRRIEQWTPITAGSHFFAGPFGEVWSLIGAQAQFPDRCNCELDFEFDNGAGLSWPMSVAPGQTMTISHETFFSPQGRGPVTESFTQSVPAPNEIVLDPVIVAQSVAIAAGVILLVPFPSALFNSTLEENYDEVMAGVARIKAWVHRQAVRFRAWIAGLIAARRQPAPGVPKPPEQAPPAQPDFAAQPAQPDFAVEPAQPIPVATEPTISLADPSSRDIWRTPLGMVGFVLLSALLYAFLDPTFGFSLNSLATYAGLAIGLFVVLAAYGVPLLLAARGRGLGLNARALPATLIVAVACVLISRLANFQPGYLYGLVVGFFFAVGVKRTEEGRAEGIAAATSLAVALIAWVLLAFMRGGNSTGDAFVQQMLSAATVTVVVAGLENAVFAMLPLQFLPGSVVREWNRWVWVAILGIGVFGFAHVLLNPSAGYMGDTTRTSFLTMVVLLAGFGIASVAFWAWFRFRPKRVAAQ